MDEKTFYERTKDARLPRVKNFEFDDMNEITGVEFAKEVSRETQEELDKKGVTLVLRPVPLEKNWYTLIDVPQEKVN